MKSATIVELKNVDLGYGGEPLIRNFSLELYAGEFTALVGPNGSGKSTLMKSIIGLLPLMGGRGVLFGNPNFSAQKSPGCIAYLPQKMSLNREVPVTVLEFLHFKLGLVDAKDAIEKVMQKLSLEKYKDASIHHLSVGELQRVFMAFCLLGSPKLILLDESVDGMDLKTQILFYKELKEISKQRGAGLMFITHDVTAVSEYADRVVCINREILYDGNPRAKEFHSCLHGIYGEKSVIHGHHHHE